MTAHPSGADPDSTATAAPRGGLPALAAGATWPRWRIVGAAALLMWLPDVLMPWNWREPGTSRLVYASDCVVFLLSYVLGSLVFLICAARLEGWLHRASPLPRALRLAAVAAALVATIEAVYALLYLVVVPWWIGVTMSPLAFWCWSVHMAVIVLVFCAWRASYHDARERAAEIERVAVEADEMHAALAGAELAVLEMQVEPHFLFNTLAHVRRELRQAPAEAARMLSALIDYLERAGPALRREDWTIADELELVETYLCLVRHRFGARLQVAVDAPAALRRARLPALAIATLVENAVQHGLAPKAEGGRLQISVAADTGAPGGVCITVSDDGVGLRESHGLGLGLATVRARLRAAFGARASLSLEAPAVHDGGGVRAAIRIAAHA